MHTMKAVQIFHCHYKVTFWMLLDNLHFTSLQGSPENKGYLSGNDLVSHVAKCLFNILVLYSYAHTCIHVSLVYL